MIRALHTAATGMLGQQLSVDVTANDLANATTNGYKESRVDFATLMSQRMRAAGTEAAAGQMYPTGIEVGLGSVPVAVTKNFSQGQLEVTEGQLDVAIQGKGFFQIQLPDGSFAYTRDGHFQIDANGALVTSSGLFLQPSITIPSNAQSVTFAQDGTVSVVDDTGAASSVGNIQIYSFLNEPGLSSYGDNLYTETSASGAATAGTPGSTGLGVLSQGVLENSNVQVVKEMVNLIVAQRAYELNSTAISTSDQMLQTAAQLK